jgi:NitT/TauT family transport system substrate-binding protein
VLRQAGPDPDRDIHTLVRPPGDYGMDLRWLHDGTIDAALVGSTMAPEAIAAEHGWQVLAWVGDHFQIPTVTPPTSTGTTPRPRPSYEPTDAPCR